MMKLSDLQVKEIIAVTDGRKLGNIADLEIDPDKGKIIALVVYDRGKKSSMFAKAEEMIIYWEQIVTIGTDVILVADQHQSKLFISKK